CGGDVLFQSSVIPRVEAETEQKFHLAFFDDPVEAEVVGSTAHPASRWIAGFEVVVRHGLSTLPHVIAAGHLLHVVEVAITSRELVNGHHDTSVSRRQPSVIDNARGVMARSGLWRG